MTIPFNTLFGQLGAIGAQVADTNTFQGTTLPADTNAWSALYSGAQFQYIDGFYTQLTAAQQAQVGFLSWLQQAYQQTIIGTVYADVPQIDLSIQSAMQELINQMVANAQTVKRNTVSGVVTAGAGNLGNGACVFSALDNNGLMVEYANVETVTLACTQDSTNGGTLDNEQFTITGQVQQPSGNPLNWDFPGGSAGQTTLNVIDAQTNLGSGNVLYNGGFETWTVPNTPDGWTIVTGSAGTQVLKSTSPVYTGTASLNLVGDGSTLTTLEQGFDTGLNTSTLAQTTQYAVSFWARMDAVPAAGVLTVDLCDGSGTSIVNLQGTSQSIVVSLPGLSHTAWVHFSGVFQLPWILPSAINLRLKLTTALSNTKNLYVDQLAMGTTSQLYQGGPSFAIFAGSNPFYATTNSPDTFSVAVANNYGGATNFKTFQALFNRCCNMTSLGLILPSTTGTPTQLDSLI